MAKCIWPGNTVTVTYFCLQRVDRYPVTKECQFGSALSASKKKERKMVSNRSVDKRLLNPREAALYLGLKVDTVYRKARLRELPSVKVGRCLRFDKDALDRLIE